MEFYLLITEKLLTDAINFANNYVNVNDEAISTIMHARNHSFSATAIYGCRAEFDVTMGSFDGAEVCELIGLYL